MTQLLEIAAVCFFDSRGALLTVRKRATHSFMLPGGKIEPAETPLAAAVREVAEELGITCDPAQLALLGRWGANAANESDTTVDAHVFVSTDQIAPAASAEIEEIRWIALDGAVGGVRLAPLLIERVIPALRAI
ncbi:MAG: NUDIX domain-containing protein [Acidimicrobiales bacterium]